MPILYCWEADDDDDDDGDDDDGDGDDDDDVGSARIDKIEVGSTFMINNNE